MVKRSWMKGVACYLVVAMFILGITPRVYAEFNPSEVISALSSDRSSDLDKIRKALELERVRERLAALGFAPDEIEKRLTQLDDRQIHELALNVEELQVGGASGWAVLIVILLIIAVVGIIIYLSGHRVVLEKEK